MASENRPEELEITDRIRRHLEAVKLGAAGHPGLFSPDHGELDSEAQTLW